MYCTDKRHKHSTQERSRKCAMDAWIKRRKKTGVRFSMVPHEVQRGPIRMMVWSEGKATSYAASPGIVG